MSIDHRPIYSYYARFFDINDTLIYYADDFPNIQYKNVLNGVGMGVITVHESHPLLQYLEDDLLVEINLQNYHRGLSKFVAPDFYGLYRDYQISTDENGEVYYLLYFPHVNEVLTRYIVAWPANTADRSVWTATDAGFVMQNIALYNCTSYATVANGRLRDASVVHSFYAGTPGSPPTPNPAIEYSAPYMNVMDALQEINKLSNVDFDVRFNTGYLYFSYYPSTSPIGDDLTTSVIFELPLDNVKSANLQGQRTGEKTVAIVGGQGEEASRTIEIVLGTNYTASNEYEVFVDARDREDVELQDAGYEKLGESEAKSYLRIDVGAKHNLIYNYDYTFGDLVTAKFAGQTYTKKIVATSVEFGQDQMPKVEIELADYVA